MTFRKRVVGVYWRFRGQVGDPPPSFPGYPGVVRHSARLVVLIRYLPQDRVCFEASLF